MGWRSGNGRGGWRWRGREGQRRCGCSRRGQGQGTQPNQAAATQGTERSRAGFLRAVRVRPAFRESLGGPEGKNSEVTAWKRRWGSWAEPRGCHRAPAPPPGRQRLHLLLQPPWGHPCHAVPCHLCLAMASGQGARPLWHLLLGAPSPPAPPTPGKATYDGPGWSWRSPQSWQALGRDGGARCDHRGGDSPEGHRDPPQPPGRAGMAGGGPGMARSSRTCSPLSPGIPGAPGCPGSPAQSGLSP